MEVEKVMSSRNNCNYNITVEDNNNKTKEEDEGAQLPGFRFHPTDEELVGFYLKRKVEKKPISIELIKQIDIYKYDPWDLPSKFYNFVSNISSLCSHIFMYMQCVCVYIL